MRDPARLRRDPTPPPEASTSSSCQHPPNCSSERQSGSAHKGLARASPAGDKLTKQAKILTPKSPARAHTHTQTKFRACSHGHNGCTHTRAASRSSTPCPTPSRTAGNWAARKLSRRRWDGEVVATKAKGRFKRERKGLPDLFSYLHWGPAKDKLGLPWAGCQTQYLSPHQPWGLTQSFLEGKWTRYGLHVEIRAVYRRRKLVFPEC